MFQRTSLLKAHTVATEIKVVDLPVDPLSHLIITIDGYNATDEATLAEILAFINKVEVTHRGESILNLESEDLVALQAYLFKSMPILTQNIATDNAARLLGLIVPFSRFLYWPEECFPATKRGELQLALNLTIPATSFDNAELHVEAVTLPGATPAAYLKSTYKSITAPGATGDNEIDLPIGNKIAALLFWNTTFPATSSHTYGINGVKIKKNNVEHMVPYSKAHTLIPEMALRLSTLPRSIAAFGDIFPDNIFWLDFDPNSDDSHLLDTQGANSLTAVLDMGVDEASKVTIAELVSL